MILNSLYKQNNLITFPHAIEKALDYLRSKDFKSMEAGTYAIQGKDIYALILDMETDCPENRKTETHKQYIDIHFLIRGREIMLYSPGGQGEVLQESEPETDAYFYNYSCCKNKIYISEGLYTIFFPGEIHCTGCQMDSREVIRKVVIKVNSDLI